ncbi:hypothetical protein NEOLEDRAFT_1179581 [Neolentinus lepideus HHB14362 ss-1]|uniref:Carboxymuconolactone decarboxylase-like domain-containing protein n=1 Tax=Neolentinus lepideus HHB14362 ss-1 TaxID=1314782 RepID=A0A165RNR0_9AGAM|nr:hypothetical protein NEOLEDRAFT_1179581 [Neolentinus lepideus HHB14362 ss-1]
MASLTSGVFLNRLKSLYPRRVPSVAARTKGMEVLSNPWYIPVAVSFGGSNRPEAVPHVFRHVLDELTNVHDQESTPHDVAHSEKLLLARKLRDSIFKAGLITGYSRAINGLVSLHESMPEELRDEQPLRDLKTPVEEYVRRGKELYSYMYGETAAPVQNLLDAIYPDMGWFSNTIGYGLTYGYTEVTSPLETSLAIVAGLIALDTPRQVNWHMGNARRLGATLEEVKAVRQIAVEVAEKSGVHWRDGVPEIID